MPSLKEALDFVEDNKDDLIKLCCNLISARSENPPGDVSEAHRVLCDFLAFHGIDPKTLEPAPGRMNLYVKIGKGSPVMILNGHIDTVPAGDESLWDFPPFCGRLIEGKILGRGATDMKGGVAAATLALAYAKKMEKKLKGTLVFAIVPDEETGSKYGTKWLLSKGLLKGDFCLIAEPSGSLAAGYSIVTGEKGALWLRLEATGKAVHGSRPHLGKNAILLALQAYRKIKRLEKEAVKIPRNASKLIRSSDEYYSAPGWPKKESEFMKWALRHYTVNLGTISGGTKVNMVPDKCAAEVDIRIPIGSSVDYVRMYVKQNLPKGVSAKELGGGNPSFTDIDHPLVKAIVDVGKKVLKTPPKPIAIIASSDAGKFRRAGIPAVMFGPGYEELCHVVNEYVLAEDVVNAAKVYAGVITKLLM